VEVDTLVLADNQISVKNNSYAAFKERLDELRKWDTELAKTFEDKWSGKGVWLTRKDGIPYLNAPGGVLQNNIYLIINFIMNIFIKKNNSLIIFSNKINK